MRRDLQNIPSLETNAAAAVIVCIKKKKNLTFIQFGEERGRQSTSREGAEREREREGWGDTEAEAGSRLRAISTEPDAGLERTDCEIVT